jgi:hypothetical protein
MLLIAEQGLLEGLLEDQKTCAEVADYFPSRPSSLFRMLNACNNDMIQKKRKKESSFIHIHTVWHSVVITILEFEH